jgi:hypothetical protein
MKRLMVMLLSSLVAACLSMAITGTTETAIIAGIECAFLSGVMMLGANSLKWRHSSYVLGAAAVIAVTAVTLLVGARGS